MLVFTVLLSAYPIYFWEKAASMMGGLTGPYLVYLHKRSPSSRQSLLMAAVTSGVYLSLVLVSMKVAGKYRTSAAGILVSNVCIFTGLVLLSFAIIFTMQ